MAPILRRYCMGGMRALLGQEPEGPKSHLSEESVVSTSASSSSSSSQDCCLRVSRADMSSFSSASTAGLGQSDASGARPSAAERSAGDQTGETDHLASPPPVDSRRCMARTWGNGLGRQCRRKRETAAFCLLHQKEVSKRGEPSHGRIDGPIPERKRAAFEQLAWRRERTAKATAPHRHSGTNGQKRPPPAAVPTTAASGAGGATTPRPKRPRPAASTHALTSLPPTAELYLPIGSSSKQARQTAGWCDIL